MTESRSKANDEKFCGSCGEPIKIAAEICVKCGVRQSQAPTSSLQKSKWYQKTTWVVIWCIFFFPVGIYGLWRNSSIRRGWKIGVTVIIAVIVLVAGNQDDQSNRTSTSSPSSSDAASSSTAPEATDVPEATEPPPAPTGVGLGEVLQTEYFDVTVNEAGLSNKVETGNEFADLQAEPGNRFIILNATFKNTGNESRMLFGAGSIFINYNGKDYEFSKAEMILADGWGLMLEELNPLTSTTTNLVFKIPEEVSGDAYWQPSRASGDEKIFLGTLK